MCSFFPLVINRLPRNTEISFKYAVIRTETSAHVESETIPSHRAFVGVKPALIECTFNQEGYIITEG